MPLATVKVKFDSFFIHKNSVSIKVILDGVRFQQTSFKS
jgi:hypothetical protein